MASNFGLLTTEDSRAPHVIGVTVDGRDVFVNKVQSCDDRRGWALLLRRDAEGRAQLNAAKTGLDFYLVTGDVEVTFDASIATKGEH